MEALGLIQEFESSKFMCSTAKLQKRVYNFVPVVSAAGLQLQSSLLVFWCFGM